MENLPQMEVRMDKKEYLKQHRLLNRMIELDLEELKRIRELSVSVSSIAFDRDYIQTTRNTRAPFEKWLDKINILEIKIANEVNLFMDLKLQILETIEQLESIDEKLVLNYRYVKGLEWDEICSLLFASERTIFRWHGNALAKLKLPENPINIKSCQLMAVDGSDCQ